MHVGIILDGNRRYAKSKNLPSWMGHKFGADTVGMLIAWAQELEINQLTLYTFSVENFNRPEKEVKVIFDLFRENLRKINEKKDEKKVRVRFIGRLDLFPKDIFKDMKEIMEKTKENRKLTVNFAMAYGGRTEIVDAVKKIAKKAKERKMSLHDINEETITRHLYLQDEPDLIIRPGGEKRVSNFLIWQGYYSEWHFTDKMWPEFTKKDLMQALDDFRQRERRYGR